MSIFFWIAAHDGCRQEDLAEACTISTSSVSRCVTWLGPRHRLEHRSGLKLIRKERDPDNYKAWRLFLTPKGKVFTKYLDNYSKQAFADFTKAKEDLKSHDDEDLG